MKKVHTMRHIAIASSHSLEFWLRQTPQGGGLWADDQFVVNDPNASALFVIDDAPQGFATKTPVERRVFVVTEPTGVRSYNRAFLEQFGLILSPFSFDTGKVPLKITQTGLPWFYGMTFTDSGVKPTLSFEDLVSLTPETKQATLSVVCSTKSNLPRHRERLTFLSALKDRLGDRLIIRGRGFTPIMDKAEAIAGSRYHLVLENNDLGCFWTEKLADAFLGWSLPLFAGPRAAVNDFPDGSLVFIDLENPQAALAKVVSILDADPYEQKLPLIAAARQKLLYEHNFFALAGRVADALPMTDLLKTPAVLITSSRASLLKRLRRSLRAGVKALLSR